MRPKVYVNEADYSTSVLVEGLEISQNITDRVSTASITFRSQAGEPSLYDEANYDIDIYSVDVKELYSVRIENRDTGKAQFSGTIRNIRPVRKSPTTVFYECQCQDWSTVLDESYIELETFEGLSDQAIIQFLVNKYTAGQLTALPENISSIVFLTVWEVREKTLRQALDEIVEFSGADWRIDWDKNLIYFLPTDFPAPFGLSSTPNSVAGQIGLTWDAMSGTWQSTGETWDETGELDQFAGSTTLTWNAITGTWDEASSDVTWVDPGEAGLVTFGIDAFTQYDRDAIRIINRCTVLGAVLPGGKRLRVVYDDPISQMNYGIRAHTVVDDQITVGATAMLRAKALVEENAYPRETISLKTFIDGLEVGQSLAIYHRAHFINGTYVIRELRIKQITRNLTEYSITAGARPPDTLRLLRTIDARSRRNTGAPVANPADGTVTDSSIATGGLTADVIESVNANSIFGTITAEKIGSVSAAVISGAINASQIATVSATSIQGVITANQVGSITATTIQGVILSNQVADGLLDRLSLYSDSLRPIPSFASPPSLPSDNHPDGAFFYNTTNGFFYKNIGGSWIVVPEGTAVAGKLEYYHIGTIKAQSIIGVILAAQIESINASQIVGQISASTIGVINVSALTGVLTAGSAAKIDVGALQGSLTVDRISNLSSFDIGLFSGTITISKISNLGAFSISNFSGSLDVGQLTGTLTTANVARINVGTMLGLLQASQIGDLQIITRHIATGVITADKITDATITATEIATLTITASNIANLTINNQKIAADLSADKIITGTINASLINVINLNAANITVGNISASRIGAGTISATISIVAPAITGGTIIGTAIQIGMSSGQLISISGAGSYVYDSLGAAEFHTAYQSAAVTGVANGYVRFRLDRLGGGGRLSLYSSTNTLAFEVSANSAITSPTASAGGASLPASPAGFLIVVIEGFNRRIPFYN